MRTARSALRGTAAFLCLWSIVLFGASAAGDTGRTRLALVIGNSSYGSLGRLNNPGNDAQDMARALQSLGFDVDLQLDAGLDAMERSIVRLGDGLSRDKDSIGFFYYAGHGIQSKGENYLIPADTEILSENFLRSKALGLQAVLDTMQSSGNYLNVVILDACRNNPFSWARSQSRGLSTVGRQPSGSIVVYATSSGDVAQDGEGRNGIFTTGLLKHIGTPGLEIKEVFNRAGRDVREATRGVQTPAVYSQFFDSAYLSGSSPAAESPAAAKTPQGAQQAQAQALPPDKPSFSIDKGSLRVSTLSAGTVSLDGKELGAVGAGQSATVQGVEQGRHRVSMLFENGKSSEKDVDVGSGETLSVQFDEGYGALRIETRTGGKLLIEGENWGKLESGGQLNIPRIWAGELSATMVYPNGKTETQAASVRVQGETTLSFEEGFGSIFVFASTSGDLYVDGKKTKRIDAAQTMNVVEDVWCGTRLLEMQYADAQKERLILDVPAGGSLEARFEYISIRLGDTGPAGGIVFYDKGSNASGWRYLEAAPKDQSISIMWGTMGKDVWTNRALGTGQGNTDSILKALGSGNYAATKCSELELGGFDDWFLPSSEELKEMYKYREALGMTRGDYWSSSSYDSKSGLFLRIENNTVYYSDKNLQKKVRAIRAF